MAKEYDAGLLAGEILARVKGIETRQTEQGEKMSGIDRRVQAITVTLATNKGFVMAVSAVISAGVAYIAARFYK